LTANRPSVNEVSVASKRRAIGAIIGTEVGAATGLFVFGGRPLLPLLVTAIGAAAGAMSVTPALRIREWTFRRWLRKSLRTETG
jgi:CBS-domain-containing membrane protein